jgi:cephalosporin hydroxylase
MYPFFDRVVAPVLEAAGVKKVVEVGALRGETTVRLLDSLGPESEIHVIDPVPAFDPSEHEKQFPGRYLFYRELSHQTLATLPAMDAALIDGDHNWYTVYHELRLLSEAARRADQPLPVLILHDVCWPYGRRDLYYAPEQIPEEFRQPYAQRGMMKGQSELLKRGGLSPKMYNALTEGGPRNGVMTALDDFIAEYDRPLRLIVLPVYFGLAIVVEEERLAALPELAELFAWLESADGKDALIEIAEDNRLQGLTVQHGVFYNAERRQAEAAVRYLRLLKGAVLNEHYLEQEVRIDHLVRSIDDDFSPSARNLRDPAREMKERTRSLRAARRVGRLKDDEGERATYFPYTAMGRVRLDDLETRLDTIRTESVRGDLVEIGAGRGGAGVFLRGYLDAYDMLEPHVWVADEFRATPAGHDPRGESTPLGGGPGFPDLLADLTDVREAFDRFDLLDQRVHFLQGPPAETLPEAPTERVALVRIGEVDPEQAIAGLDAVYDRITLGGYVVVDRYASPALQAAVDAFRERHGVVDPIERIDFAGACWRKTVHRGTGPVGDAGAPDETEEAAASPATLGARQTAGAPLLAARGGGRKDLSVVVVFYDMLREAPRTLHSLSRAYQQGIDDVDYEVIVVENGSSPGQKVDKAFVRSFGPEFRYLDLGRDATASPVPALNAGIAMSRGENIAVMIDGAHVLTPGVLRYGLLGLHSYAPAVVATQQWYVGPGQQGDAMAEGYDQAYEDQLFEKISWPEDGYRLFDIGSFIGDRDWLDGLWESNCLFAPRALFEQVGGFDESFSMPGGGYANLELYERLGATPGTAFVSILGEGSFHQVHGGTTTNLTEFEQRHDRLSSYARHYEELRGRPFRGHGQQIHYVGTMRPDAARTRARRRIAPEFFKRGITDGPDGPPTEPIPVPQDLRADAIEAFWHSLKWQDTNWLGKRIPKAPTDLFVYQEILNRVRPDWIVETGTAGGGRALFLASICDLIGHGQVLSVDKRAFEGLPTHDRIQYLVGPPHEDETAAQVRDIVGTKPRALVILGSRGTASRTIKEFRAYAPLVPRGSYVVVEDTVVNGHPVWSDFGNGPAEAVRSVVEERGDFAADLDLEKYLLTFNPGGFLKRVR